MVYINVVRAKSLHFRMHFSNFVINKLNFVMKHLYIGGAIAWNRNIWIYALTTLLPRVAGVILPDFEGLGLLTFVVPEVIFHKVLLPLT